MFFSGGSKKIQIVRAIELNTMNKSMLYNYNRTLEQRWEDVYSSCHEESEGILL
jgi:hypothetical protein